jgi:hypothetical protein
MPFPAFPLKSLSPQSQLGGQCLHCITAASPFLFPFPHHRDTTAPAYSPGSAFPSSQAYECLRRPSILHMAAAGDAAKEYVAGAAAGVAQVVVGHPFDTVKVYFCLSSHRFHCCLSMCRSPRILSCFLVSSVCFVILAMLCPYHRCLMKCLQGSIQQICIQLCVT